MNYLMNPLISVIVPVYNVERYLNQSVQSVLRQDYHNLEIVLIDDGSTDKSGKICDKLAKQDSRIKVIHKKMVVCQMLVMWEFTNLRGIISHS